MSVKTQRRHARRLKQARRQAHEAAQATHAAQDSPTAPAVPSTPVTPESAPAAPAGPAPYPQPVETPADGDVPQAEGFDRPSLREAYRPTGSRALPPAYLTPPIDAHGAYVPLAEDVRAGIVDAVVTGLRPLDAARLFGLTWNDFLEHLRHDAGLSFDINRAELALKFQQLERIHAARRSEEVRAARWFLKTRWPEEYDPVIVSRRVRAEMQAQREAEAQARKAEAEAAEARKRAVLFGHLPPEAYGGDDPYETAAPVHSDDYPAAYAEAAPVDAAQDGADPAAPIHSDDSNDPPSNERDARAKKGITAA